MKIYKYHQVTNVFILSSPTGFRALSTRGSSFIGRSLRHTYRTLLGGPSVQPSFLYVDYLARVTAVGT